MSAPIARVVSRILRLVAAAILAQTLFFKFTGAAESRWIFAQLGAEPWGRLGSGAIELVAVLLLVWPRTAVVGALLTAAVMLGAIGSHVLVLGIAVQEDGGLLFGLACLALCCALGVLWLRKSAAAVVPA